MRIVPALSSGLLVLSSLVVGCSSDGEETSEAAGGSAGTAAGASGAGAGGAVTAGAGGTTAAGAGGAAAAGAGGSGQAGAPGGQAGAGQAGVAGGGQGPGGSSGQAGAGASGTSGQSGAGQAGAAGQAGGCEGEGAVAYGEPAAVASAPTTKDGWSAQAGDTPGGKVTLSSATEAGKAGVKMSYAMCDASNACSSYVAATWKLAKATAATSVRLRVRAREHGSLFVRVVDDEGQTFAYWLWREPESNEGDLATYRLVLDAPDKEAGYPYAASHFGGPNDGKFSGSIRSVTVGYGTFFGKQIEGDLFFTDVAVLGPDDAPVDTTVDVTSDGFRVPAKASKPGDVQAGISLHFVDDQAMQEKHVAMAKDMGFTFIRRDFSWSSVEKTKGVYSLDGVTKYTKLVTSAGLGMHLLLDYGNKLYSGTGDDKTGPSTDAYRAAFVEYARQIVKATKGPEVHYEVWNEPNVNGFWRPESSPEDYGKLCKATMVGVKPLLLQGERITAGSLSNSSAAFKFLRDFEASGGCLADKTNGIATSYAYHPYRSTPETWGQMLEQIRMMMPSNNEVVSTEWGYSSQSPFNINNASNKTDGHTPEARKRQAVSVARRFLVETSLGLPWSTYYDMIDDGKDGTYNEHNYGLFDADLVIKPAGVVARRLLALPKAQPFSGWQSAAEGRVHAARFSGATGVTLALWSDARGKTGKDPSFRVHLRCAGLGQDATDMLGAPLSIERKGDDCSVVVSEPDGPVFVTYDSDCAP